MLSNVMHDLETLDTKETSVVLSIGAVKFNADGTDGTFYRRLNISEQIERGRTVSGDTITWWMLQGGSARAVFSEPSVSVYLALKEYSAFLGGETCNVWGNGAMFDNAILLNLYAQYSVPRPWSYKNDRCYRTVLAQHKDLHPAFETVKPVTAHNAMDDAFAQALTLQKIWNGDQV